jgi:hypothetical protein
MYNTYDEVSVMTKSHLDDLKYDQACCLRSRELRLRARESRRKIMSRIHTLLAAIGGNGKKD